MNVYHEIISQWTSHYFHGYKDGTFPFSRHIPEANENLRSVEVLELELTVADLNLGVLRPLPNEGW